MPRSNWVMVPAAAVVLAMMVCLLTGCGRGEQTPATPATVLQEREAATFGPSVTATQPDLPGDLEFKEAMVLLARLVAENPTARTITITASTVSNIEKKPYKLTWKYDREANRFVYRQEDRESGLTEYQYSKVTDEVFTDLGKRAGEEFVDYSAVHGYGCPYKLVRNGKVVLSEP